MATTLQYNSVDFGFLKTHSIDHKPEYDPSKTDQIHTIVTLTVESLLYLANDGTFYKSASQEGGNQTPPLLAQRIKLLQSQLEQPRKPLYFYYNGVLLAPSVGGIDEALGPRVLYCRIIQLTDMAVKIEWSCEVAINLIDFNGTTPLTEQNPISSLRWETIQDIDDNGYTTFDTTGLLIGRSNVLYALGAVAPKQGVDMLKKYICPPLYEGFIRQGKYTIQADGLRIKFTLRDRQQFQQPFGLFVKCKGRFIQRAENNAKWVVSVHLTATYQYDKDRLDAVGQALNIAVNRIMAANLQTSNGIPVFKQGIITEHMYDPIVEIYLEALANPPTKLTLTAPSQSPGLWDGPTVTNPSGTGTSSDPKVAAQKQAAIDAYNANLRGLGTIGMAAVTTMGFGYDPSPSPTDPATGKTDAILLTGDQNTGMLSQGLKILAIALQDESTAIAANNLATEPTVTQVSDLIPGSSPLSRANNVTPKPGL